MFIELNEEFARITGEDISSNFIAEIQKNMLESLSNWDVGNQNMRNNFRKSFMTREQDILMGSRDIESGEKLPSIPLLYRDNLHIELTTKELNNLKQELESKDISIEDTQYEEELEKLVRTKEREKGLKIKSHDLFSSTLIFGETAYTYEYTKDVEDEIKAIKDNLRNVKTNITTPHGGVLTEKITGKIAKMLGAPKSELEAMEKFVNMYVYGKTIQNKDIAIGKNISLNKTIYQVMRYTSAKALGGSWLTAMGNAIGTTSNTIMLASEGKYFTKKQIYKSIKMIINQDDRTASVLKYFAPYSHEITTKMKEKLSTRKLSRVINEEALYILMKFPDKGIDMVTTLGVLQNWGIDKDGNIRRINKNIKSILDTATIKDGQIQGLTDTQYLDLRKLMTNAAFKIKGNASKEDQNLIGTNMFLHMLMQFRNWMPGLLGTRFEGLKYKEEYDDLDVGRFRVLFGEFTKKGLLPKLKTFGNLLAETASFGIYKGFTKSGNTELAQRYYNKLIKENPKLRGKITIEQLMELRKQKLKGMATELQFVVGMYVLVAMISATIPDEDKDKYKKFMAMNSYRMMNRGLLELTFFFDPRSLSYIIERPLPMWKNIPDAIKMISNTLDEGRDWLWEEDYKGFMKWQRDNNDLTGKMHYTTKMIPARAITDIFDVFDTFEKQMNNKY